MTLFRNESRYTVAVISGARDHCAGAALPLHTACEEGGTRTIDLLQVRMTHMLGEVDSEGIMAGNALFIFISNGITRMNIGDPSFLTFPGASSKTNTCVLLFLLYFTASAKNFRYAESNLRASQFKSDLRWLKLEWGIFIRCSSINSLVHYIFSAVHQ
jgi:hypothetical protein